MSMFREGARPARPASRTQGRAADDVDPPPREAIYVHAQGATDNWDVFADLMLLVLMHMEDGDELTFYAPPDEFGHVGECTVRVDIGNKMWVCATAPPSHYSLMLLYADDVEAGVVPVVTAIEEYFGDLLEVPVPSLLTVSASGAVSLHTSAFRMGERSVEPAEPSGDELGHGDLSIDEAIQVEDADEIRRVFEPIVERVLGASPATDEDGDLVFEHAGVSVYATFPEDEPGVHLWAILVPRVRSRRAAAVELAVRNRESPWVQWILQGHAVVQRVAIPAGPSVPRHMQFYLEQFLRCVAVTTPDLEIVLADDPHV